MGNLGFWWSLYFERAIFQPEHGRKTFSRNYCSSDFMWLQTQGDPFKGLETVFLLPKRVNFIPSLWVLEEAILRNILKNSVCLEMPYVARNWKGRETIIPPNNCLPVLNKEIINSIFNQQMLYFQI